MTAKSYAGLDAHTGLLIGILMACVGHAFFNIGDAAMKMVASRFHFSQIMFTNSAMVIGLFCFYGWLVEGRAAFQTKKAGLMAVRAVLAQLVMLCNIFALPNIQLSTFYTLIFTSPLWVALISAFFFQEKLERGKLGVILGGFAVILFIFRPGSEMFNVWALLVLLSAFFYSWQLVLLRKIGHQESRIFMVLSGAVLSLLWTAPIMPYHYLAPTAYEWGLFFMMSVLGTVGLLCIAYGFQVVPSAAAVAPYHYSQIIWGTLLGYFLFNEIPNAETMIGAGVIILAGLYLILSETRKKKRALEGF